MPIKVAVFNNKGGVGKTTISIILTQIALKHGCKVLAIDQDEQQNFSKAIDYLEKDPNYKDRFTMLTVLKQEYFNLDYDIMIIDCTHGFNELTRKAINNADIVIIPIRPDKFSIEWLDKIKSLSGDRHLRHYPIVKVDFLDGGIHDKTAAAKEISREISKEISRYRVIGDLPINKTINYNLSTGKTRWWSIGLTASARQPFELLYTKLIWLYAEILNIRAIEAEIKRKADDSNSPDDYHSNPENAYTNWSKE